MTISPPSDDYDDEARACAICGRVLAQVNMDGGRYRHSEQDLVAGVDHVAVPVRYEELGENLRGRCDFCSAEGPTYVVYTSQTQMPMIETGFDSDWSACDACAELVMADKWRDLLHRSLDTFRAHYGAMSEEAVLEIRVLHYKVRKNMVGIAKEASV